MKDRYNHPLNLLTTLGVGIRVLFVFCPRSSNHVFNPSGSIHVRGRGWVSRAASSSSPPPDKSRICTNFTCLKRAPFPAATSPRFRPKRGCGGAPFYRHVIFLKAVQSWSSPGSGLVTSPDDCEMELPPTRSINATSYIWKGIPGGAGLNGPGAFWWNE